MEIYPDPAGSKPHGYGRKPKGRSEMKNLKWMVGLGMLVLILGCNKNSAGSGSSSGDQSSGSGAAQQQGASSSSYDADNTGRNERDRPASAVTPGDQGGSDTDREMTRRIRRALVANDQMSADAKNIKVITVNGKVTLRGPVKDAQEAQAVQQLAQQAGAGSIDNQLEVKGGNQ